MPIEITIPRLGWNMDEGVFVGWLKQDGDAIREGDPLFSLEGEKATQDVEAIDAGVLSIPPDAPKPGAVVPVGAVVGYLLQTGESAAKNGGPAFERPRAESPRPAVAVAPVERASTVAERTPRVRISPLARRIAKERGVDWSRLTGSGSSGRIRKVDILAAAAANGERPHPEPRSTVLSPIRRAIATRMVESHRTTAPVTLTTTIDATNLVNLRGQFRALGGEVPAYTDFIVKLVAVALREHPPMNARWESERIALSDDVHIGIAVDTDAGLLVPVIRDAAVLSLREIAARSRDLISRARDQRLRMPELQGGTFTITNLGAFGVDAFTPIINPPECAILGLGRIQKQPVMHGEQFVGRDRMTLSLTFDHRIVDGAPAARFLQRVGQLIENPGPWLIS